MRLISWVPVLSALYVAAACANGSSLPSDGSAPSVRIDAPLAGADVGRQVTIDVTAIDDHGVDVVRYLIDNVLLIEQRTPPPFQVFWSTNLVPDSSSHTITVEALDVAKNKGFQSITVRVVKGLH